MPSSSVKVHKKNNKTCFCLWVFGNLMNEQRLLQTLNTSHAAVYNLLLTDTTQYVFGLESSEKPLSSEKNPPLRKNHV